MPTLAWTWISSLDVLGSFHINFRCFQLYNHIPITLQHNVQGAFCFALGKLTQDPYDVATWHLLLLLPQWCFDLPPNGRAIKHKEM
jgi:hypothetical protein